MRSETGDALMFKRPEVCIIVKSAAAVIGSADSVYSISESAALPANYNGDHS